MTRIADLSARLRAVREPASPEAVAAGVTPTVIPGWAIAAANALDEQEAQIARLTRLVNDLTTAAASEARALRAHADALAAALADCGGGDAPALAAYEDDCA